MNTIPGKIRKFARDSLISLKHVLRKRPFVIEKPPSEFKSLEADLEALDSICYYLLGTSFDAILDIICEYDVPHSHINPLLLFLVALIFFQIPTLLIYVEILGSVPGRATLYSYSYTGISEAFAFLCGWIWIGASASRIAMVIHFFSLSILECIKHIIDVEAGSKMVGFFIYLFLPFASKRMTVSTCSSGAAIRVGIILFLLVGSQTDNWALKAGSSSPRQVMLSTFSFLELSYTLPIVSPMLQKAHRTRMLIRKMILIMVCVVIFQTCFFLTLIGNIPYIEATKHWVTILVGRIRPLPYIILFASLNYISLFSGVLATMHSASVILEQMSSDGLIFKFFSFSEKLRLIFILFNSIFIFIYGFETSRDMFNIMSSIGIIFAALALLFLRSVGHPGFYDRAKHKKAPEDKKKKKEIFMDAVAKSMLLFLVIGCIMVGFVLRRLLSQDFDPSSVNFFLFMIALSLVGVALLILTVVPKFKSVHASIRCPLGPYIPVFVMLIASINSAIQSGLVTVGISLWMLSGLFLYLVFGLKNVTILTSPEAKDGLDKKRRSDFEYNEFEDYRIFEILKPRLETCKIKLARRKRDLELIGAPPLCKKRDLVIIKKKNKKSTKKGD